MDLAEKGVLELVALTGSQHDAAIYRQELADCDP